jgi:transcriptional regulator with XRE-family HTH domain
MKKVGKRIKLARYDTGLTQSEIATEAGTSIQSWGKYENGTVLPRVDMLAPFSVRGYSIDWIMSGQGEMKISTNEHSISQPEINSAEGMMITKRVLESGTGYANALWHNLKSFDAAVEKESKVKELERKMDLMLGELAEVRKENAEIRATIGVAVPEKKSVAS